MATRSVRSDKGIGLAVLFSILGLLGALGMLLLPLPSVAAGQETPELAQFLSAWAFALAMVAGSLAVLAVHAYEA